MAHPTPTLLPLPVEGSPIPFWPVCAINDDLKAQAVEALLPKLQKPKDYVTRMALRSSILHLQDEVRSAVKNAISDGHLLFCWQGSSALVAGLTPATKGGAA